MQEAEYPVGEHNPQFTDKSALLEQFSAQIERNVLGIDNTFAKSQSFGQNVFCLVLNQHLAAVNTDPRSRLRTRRVRTAAIVFEVNNDFRSIIDTIRFTQLIRSRSAPEFHYYYISYLLWEVMEVLPIRTPVQSNTAWLARFCEDFYFSSNHECQMKAHTKLADDIIGQFGVGFSSICWKSSQQISHWISVAQ
jgi:hypothetical protein